MTSSNGSIFLVTGPLWGEFTGHRWIPFTKDSNAELWYFLWSVPEQRLSKQSRRKRFETPLCSLWRHYKNKLMARYYSSTLLLQWSFVSTADEGKHGWIIASHRLSCGVIMDLSNFLNCKLSLCKIIFVCNTFNIYINDIFQFKPCRCLAHQHASPVLSYIWIQAIHNNFDLLTLVGSDLLFVNNDILSCTNQ